MFLTNLLVLVIFLIVFYLVLLFVSKAQIVQCFLSIILAVAFLIIIFKQREAYANGPNLKSFKEILTYIALPSFVFTAMIGTSLGGAFISFQVNPFKVYIDVDYVKHFFHDDEIEITFSPVYTMGYLGKCLITLLISFFLVFSFMGQIDFGEIVIYIIPVFVISKWVYVGLQMFSNLKAIPYEMIRCL